MDPVGRYGSVRHSTPISKQRPPPFPSLRRCQQARPVVFIAPPLFITTPPPGQIIKPGPIPPYRASFFSKLTFTLPRSKCGGNPRHRRVGPGPRSPPAPHSVPARPPCPGQGIGRRPPSPKTRHRNVSQKIINPDYYFNLHPSNCFDKSFLVFLRINPTCEF